ncbi:MAG: serine hydroxymethyltransferase [Thermoplasmatales archaeon]
MNIYDIIRKQEIFRKRVLPLQPSENTIPRDALSALSSDFEQRYSLVINSSYRNQKIRNAYAGTRYSEMLVSSVEKLAKRIFKTGFADVRPISGHIAAMQVIGSLLKRGERFAYIPVAGGGYDGYTPKYLPALFGIKGEEIPMKGWKIDYQRMRKMKGNYSAVILGASIFLHPYRIDEIMEVFHDALILYDASHVLGLLANGKFQPDFGKADVIYGSTHKNFPGPQGGLIVGRSDLEERIKKDAIWMYYDNFHLSRVSSLGISLEYLSRTNYGERCIRNTNALARALTERDVELANLPEVTESAMFLLNYENAPKISKRLEKSNILIDSIGRVGLNEITMLGFTEKHMDKVAEAMELGIRSSGTEAGKIVRDLLSEIRSS